MATIYKTRVTGAIQGLAANIYSMEQALDDPVTSAGFEAARDIAREQLEQIAQHITKMEAQWNSQ